MMSLKKLFFTLVTGLLHYVVILSTFELTDKKDDSVSESLFDLAFNNDSIVALVNSEVDEGLAGTLTEIVEDVPFRQLIEFQLFTRFNPEKGYTLKIGDKDNLKRSPFNNRWKTKILIHGWQYLVTYEWIPDMRKEYLKADDYNIIKVDWDVLSTNEYLVSTHLTRLVGERTGKLLKFLHRVADVPYWDFHLIGHSLGAHIAGFAGAKVSGAIGRITGLDAARPYFEVPKMKRPNSRLDPTDAMFVDVIHTNSGKKGFRRAIGHVDFYPNGGSWHPGCPRDIYTLCNHFRGVLFMIDSIMYPEEFIAVECDNWKNYKRGECANGNTVIMGEYINSRSRGVYYLETNSESPFGKGDIEYDDW